MNAPTLPRVLVFSEGVLSLSHGTGTIFARNFSFYPRERLANWFIGGDEDPLLPGAVNLSPHRWPSSPLRQPLTLPAKLWNRLGVKPVCNVPVNAPALRTAVRAQSFTPDLVYGIVISRTGIDCLYAVLSGLPAHVRVILQIQDFFPTGQLGFMRALRRLAPRIAEVWGVSRAILEMIRPHLPGVPQRFDPLFYLNLPDTAKTTHRPFSPDFRTIIIGNFWTPALLGDVRAIWAELQRQLPGLPAVRWHCHPSGVQRVRDAGFEPGNEVEPAPFLTGDALFEELRAADLALVPFSRQAEATTDYERFSMPSRLTELCPAGLPIFCLSGRGTPAHDYVIEHGIGRCSPASDTARTAAQIAALIRDVEARQALGHAARRHAETHFQLAPFQDWLGEKFHAIAATRP